MGWSRQVWPLHGTSAERLRKIAELKALVERDAQGICADCRACQASRRNDKTLRRFQIGLGALGATKPILCSFSPRGNAKLVPQIVSALAVKDLYNYVITKL